MFVQGKRKKRKRDNKPDSKPEGRSSFLLPCNLRPCSFNFCIFKWPLLHGIFFTLTQTNPLSCFYTLASSLWSSVLIVAGMSAVCFAHTKTASYRVIPITMWCVMFFVSSYHLKPSPLTHRVLLLIWTSSRGFATIISSVYLTLERQLLSALWDVS